MRPRIALAVALLATVAGCVSAPPDGGGAAPDAGASSPDVGAAAPDPDPSPSVSPAAAAEDAFAACRARWAEEEDWSCVGTFPSGGPPPAFVTAHFIDSADVASVSLFRSGAGHDYSDDAESCRSMKHYFEPRGWAAAPLRAPADGVVFYVKHEHVPYGRQVAIAPDAAAGALVVAFHVDVAPDLRAGDRVAAGDLIGHVVERHSTDVAVFLFTAEGRRLVSYFDVMSDDAFAAYREHGVGSREKLVMSRAERDASPLECEGEAFVPPARRAEDWVALEHAEAAASSSGAT